MKKDNKKALYESIMTSVAKEVKKALNEWEDDPYHKVSLEDAKEFANKCDKVFTDYDQPVHSGNRKTVIKLLGLDIEPAVAEARLDYLLDSWQMYENDFDKFIRMCRNVLTAIEYNKTGGYPFKIQK